LKEKFKMHRESNWTSSRPHISDVASSLIGRNRAQKSPGNISNIANSVLEDDQGVTTTIDAKDLHVLLAIPSTRFSLSHINQDWGESDSHNDL
jgi:hypothetical protein